MKFPRMGLGECSVRLIPEVIGGVEVEYDELERATEDLRNLCWSQSDGLEMGQERESTFLRQRRTYKSCTSVRASF